jgi:GDP-L-fucose synthase
MRPAGAANLTQEPGSIRKGAYVDLNFLKGKKLLVAGGSGQLGTALTRLFTSRGIEVESSFLSSKPVPELSACYRKYDFTRYDDCLEATRGKDIVLICAAQTSGIQTNLHSPTAALRGNLAIYSGLFEACSSNAVEKALFISSSTVYQEACHPVREEELDLNLPVYDFYLGIGGMYRYLEQLGACYFRTRGLPVGMVRTSNIYGPYDHFEDDKSHVIPALIKRALGKAAPFTVWGSADTVRDFVYVDDLVTGLLRVLQGECGPEPINISSGTATSIGELVQAVLDTCGHRVAVQFDDSKPSAVPYRVLDNTRCDELFGKFPRTPLTSGIARTVEWYRSTLAQN